jgi:hypothetical protein
MKYDKNNEKIMKWNTEGRGGSRHAHFKSVSFLKRSHKHNAKAILVLFSKVPAQYNSRYLKINKCKKK